MQFNNLTSPKAIAKAIHNITLSEVRDLYVRDHQRLINTTPRAGILRDEVGHVAIGNRWFHHLCRERGLDAVLLYPRLVKQYEAPRMRPPFNEAARKAAGFTEEEMAFLLWDG